MQKLQLEINKAFIPSVDTFKVGDGIVMMTPDIGEDHWLFRVKLYKDQAIIGFPKFMTIGIGFAKEEDWNTNLPYNVCTAEEIYNHIRHNKAYKQITKKKCLDAIKMIQAAADEYKSIWK